MPGAKSCAFWLRAGQEYKAASRGEPGGAANPFVDSAAPKRRKTPLKLRFAERRRSCAHGRTQKLEATVYAFSGNIPIDCISTDPVSGVTASGALLGCAVGIR
mgnify:CR=1 FL=1